MLIILLQAKFNAFGIVENILTPKTFYACCGALCFSFTGVEEHKEPEEMKGFTWSLRTNANKKATSLS